MEDIQQKLKVIQNKLNITQTKLADRFGVSFVAFNNWWTGKSIPRKKMGIMIDDLFLEVTGQKTISSDKLIVKKQSLKKKSSGHKSVIEEILQNKDIYDEFVLKLTYHSNSIEGSTLTEGDTAAILFDNVSLPNKTLTEQLEAKNHQTALNYLFDYISKKEKINESLILKLHSILMNGIRSDAGMYRNHGVRILGVSLPTANYAQVPDLMKSFIPDLENDNNDIVSISANVHSHFEQIHPFSDGNGRVGRLLMTAMLLKANLAPAVIHQQQKQLYYTYLFKAQTKNDQSQLEDFLCDAILDGFDILERTNK
ncbi:MAG: Fic family protein [Nanoarchaeota archaeon]|nr:Fic family protein [Nanoarchaeota archaeon]